MIDYGFGVKLGPVTEKALPLLFNWRNDSDLYKNFRQFRPISWEEHVEWYRSLHRNDRVRMFIVGHDDKMIGVVGLTSIDRINSRAELSSYVADEKYAGLEIEAIKTILKYGWYCENLHSVFAEVFDFNAAKCNDLRNLNFIQTGHLSDSYYRNGFYIGVYHYTIIRPEEYKTAAKKIDRPAPGGENKLPIKTEKDPIDDTLDKYLD